MYRFMRFPDGREKALTFSYDDGIKADIRLAGLFDSYGFKGTFNINSANIGAPNRLTKEEIQEHILDKGHEVAIHGQYHQAPGVTSVITGIQEFLNCRLALEKEFGAVMR